MGAPLAQTSFVLTIALPERRQALRSFTECYSINQLHGT
jgi:hypothetical protein